MTNIFLKYTVNWQNTNRIQTFRVYFAVQIEEMSAQNHIPTERPTPKIPSTELDWPIISHISELIFTSFAFPTPAGLEDNLEARTVHLKGEGGTMLAWASVSFPVCFMQVQWALGYQGRTILTSCGLFRKAEDNAVPLGYPVLLPPPLRSLHTQLADAIIWVSS